MRRDSSGHRRRIIRRIGACGLLFALWAGTAPGGEVKDHFLIRARAAAEIGEIDLALAVAEDGLERSSDAPHGWLLVARLRGEKGDFRGALDAYGKAEREVPLLGDCADLERSHLALRCGHFEEAEAGYREGLERFPQSPHAARMWLGLGRAAGTLGHATTARDALQTFVGLGRPEEETVEALWLLGHAMIDLEDWRGGQAVFQRLWTDYPATPEGDAAGDALESLEETRGLAREPLSAEQMFERARRLRHGGRFSGAIDQLKKILKIYPDHSIVPEVLYEEGSLYFRLVENRRAIDTLKLLLKEYPQFDSAPDALYLIARAYWRKGFRHHFLSTCDEIRETYPGQRAAEDAEFALGVFYAERGKRDEARAALGRIVAGPREHSRRRNALWHLGRMDYRDGRYEDAYGSFSDLASEESSGYWKAATYWAGRSLHRLGREGEALGVLRQLVERYPGDYYGIQAGKRLKDVERPAADGDGAAADPVVDFGLPPGWGGDPYVRILLLEEVGLYDLAVEEMRALLNNAPPGARLKFAHLAQKAGEYRMGTDDIENHYARLIETLAMGLPREFWEVSFPFAHRSDVERMAGEFELDPLLVAAVIREESRFEEDAVSRAGAMGLLQLMPETAKDEARRLGMRTRNLNLFDPITNLRLGTYSLSRRLERFDGNLIMTLAGYNAGDHRVRRWRDELRGLETDEFIDQMPYLETRLYVKRILASYEHYRRIYGRRDRPEENTEIGLTPAETHP